MNKIQLTWTKFKALITPKNFKINYIDTSNSYYIWVDEGITTYFCGIEKNDNADQTDFEDNYKPTANNPVITLKDLSDKIGEVQDTPTQYTLLRRLKDVEAGLSGITATMARYRPKFYTSKANIGINGSDTQLVSLDFDGQLDGISIAFDKEEVECILIVDGTEIFRVELKDLNNQSEYGMSLSNKNFNVSTENSGNQIIFHWSAPVDIISNLTIKAKNSSNMYAIMVAYREKVT